MSKCSVFAALALFASVEGLFGGVNIDINLFPHQVYVSFESEIFDCSGAIISEFWVITSGQCVGNLKLPMIRAGSSHRQMGGSLHTVALVKVHDDFHTRLRYEISVNDIALIKVNEPFEFGSTCQPIGLFDAGEEAKPGALALVSSWGDQENNPGGYFLKMIVIPIVDRRDCSNIYAKFGVNLDKEICAGYSNGKDSPCFGDSGAPLTINGRLAGLFSWGRRELVGDKPGVYTEISAHRDWIKTISGV